MEYQKCFQVQCLYCPIEGPIPRFEFPLVKERGTHVLVQGKKELQESVVQLSFYVKELAQYDQLLYWQ
jgi:hypothetical protein